MNGDAGPLAGYRMIEVAGIGPGPYCGMLLSDLGAEVVTVERAGGRLLPAILDPLLRNRRSMLLDLKQPADVETLLRLAEKADALFEGFRPGVAERLGIGPDACLARNPRLVYGRVTGWGQEGPLAQAAGHDLNYVALSGLLHMIGPKGGKPVPPLNVVGDFGGGGLLLAYGIVCALLERSRSGRGQVVDAAMLDGVASFMTMFYGLQAAWRWPEEPGAAVFGGAAPYYDTYETSDGKFVSVASIEPQFLRVLVEKAGLDPVRFSRGAFPLMSPEIEHATWPELKRELEALFRTRTRAEWCALLEGTDACFAPVLTMSEAPLHPHHVARGTYIRVAGVTQAAPAPRFSRSRAATPAAPRGAGDDTAAVLADWGVTRA